MVEKVVLGVICLIIAAVWAFIADLIAKYKGYSTMLYFWLGFFFWPFGVFIAALQPNLVGDVKDDSFGADVTIPKNARKPILGVADIWYQDMPVDLVHNQIVVNRKKDHAYLKLTFLNRGEKVIHSLHLQITCLDECGDLVCPTATIYYAYQDLTVLPGEYFGEDTYILLPSAITRKVQLKPVKMLFADDTVLRESQIAWDKIEYLPKLISLKQKSPYYPIIVDKFTEKNSDFPALYVPEQLDEQIWSCFCGKVNDHTHICTRCGREKEKVFAVYNPQFLEQEVAVLLADRERYKYWRTERGLE